MQEDSPGEQDKRIRNQRYNTPTKPKKLLVSTAKNKAKEFAAKDDKSTRVLAKQAILKELNTQLFVKAQGIAPQSRRKGDKTGGDTGMVQKFQGNVCRMSNLCYGGKFKSWGWLTYDLHNNQTISVDRCKHDYYVHISIVYRL